MSEIYQLIKEGERLIAEYDETYNGAFRGHSLKGGQILYISDALAFFERVTQQIETELKRRAGEQIPLTEPRNLPALVENPTIDEDITDGTEYYNDGFPITDIALKAITNQLRTTVGVCALEDYGVDSEDFFTCLWEFENLIKWKGLFDIGPFLPSWKGRATFEVHKWNKSYEKLFLIGLPDGIQDWIVDALAQLEKAHRVTYEPDIDKRRETLAYARYAAAYGLFLWQNDESYSEESIRAFEASFRTYGSVHGAVGSITLLKDLGELAGEKRQQVGLQVRVGLHLFRIRAKDLDPVVALEIYTHTLSCAAAIAATNMSYTPIYELLLAKLWDDLEEEMHEQAKFVFAGIREASTINVDWSEIASYVEMILKSAQSPWVDPEAELTAYWTGALWWVRGAKLEPGELRDFLGKEEGERAQQRVKRYFFNKQQWETLPERAQVNLIEADRVWFSPRRGNPGAILVHLQTAAEELLYDLFGSKTLSAFLNMVQASESRYSLATTDFTESEKRFVNDQLPNHVRRLKDNRNWVVHATGQQIVRPDDQEMAELFTAFMGIGCQGILPRLADLRLKLFPIKRPLKR